LKKRIVLRIKNRKKRIKNAQFQEKHKVHSIQ